MRKIILIIGLALVSCSNQRTKREFHGVVGDCNVDVYEEKINGRVVYYDSASTCSGYEFRLNTEN